MDLTSEYTNLLEETKEKLADCHKTPKDVLWIGTSDGSEAITWEEFEQIANFDYDSGYGTAEIRLDLVVVGRDWWLERYEYDGAEWWVYKEQPKLLENHKKLSMLRGN